MMNGQCLHTSVNFSRRLKRNNDCQGKQTIKGNDGDHSRKKEGKKTMFLHKTTADGMLRYSIIDTMNSEGKLTGKPRTVAYFDTLENAAMVLRYLKGANMPFDDQNTALSLMAGWDIRKWEESNAVTEESKSTASITDATN